MKKIYVDKDNRATFICPKCGYERILDAMNFRGKKEIVKGQCRCEETFQFVLEYRRHYRKDVRLPGIYTVPESGEDGGLTVSQLSMSGIRFETLGPHQISEDDILVVKFTLDDDKEAEICKPVKVIWVNDRIVGGKFTEIKFYEKDLGFYLTV